SAVAKLEERHSAPHARTIYLDDSEQVWFCPAAERKSSAAAAAIVTARLRKPKGRHEQPQRSYFFSPEAKSARIATLPSAPSFRTRGTQSLALSVFVYSNTNTSLPRTAIPVGDQGFSDFSTVSTLPSLEIFTTQRRPVTAA